MSVEVVAASASQVGAELTAVAFLAGGPTAAVEGAPNVDGDVLARRGFEGKVGQTALVEASGAPVLAVGLGDPDKIELDTLRRFGAAVARGATRVDEVTVLIPTIGDRFTDAEVSQAITEGILLGNYRFTAYKSEPDARRLRKAIIAGGDQFGVRHGVVIAEATAFARDLINHPPITMTPTRLAQEAVDVANRVGLQIEVFDETRIEAERLGGLMGVARGSDQPPRLVKMTYAPDHARATVGLVGKGITFDSGGISLKPPDSMVTMKTDMSGAAAVIATMSVLPELAPDVKVVAWACITENMPGPKAVKPGDVLHARNGKTIEVVNTDAEGRLVLADGLSLAVEEDVDVIIDVATLTGACVVALGNEIAGLMSNDDSLRAGIERAAMHAGENVWHLPLPKYYRKHIESEIADMKNLGMKGSAGTLSAGLFLQEFVGDKPWVHLDIAGPARAESDDGYMVKGGTGFGVRTLIEFVTSYEAD